MTAPSSPGSESTYGLLRQAARTWPDAIATQWIPDPADYRRCLALTYADLAGAVTRIANGLAALGVGRADAVTLCGPNSSGLLAATMAAQAAGIAAPVNPTLSAEQIAGLIRRSRSQVLIAAGPEADPELWQRLTGVARQAGIRGIVALRPDGAVGQPPALRSEPGLAARYLEELGDGQPSDRLEGISPPAAADLAAFVHTGGTTGAPKIAAHTHANQLACTRGIAEWAGLAPGDGVLAGLPLFHVNALIVTGIAPLLSGTRVVWPGPAGYRDQALYPRFWKLVEHYQIVAMSAVPTVYGALARVPVDADISSLRIPIVGASPLPTAVREGFAQHTGRRLLEGYGLTEATCASTWNRPGADRPGSVGQVLPGQQAKAVRIGADGSWQDCEPGEPGLLVIGGSAVFAGYVTDPRGGGDRVSQGDTVRDGWLDTGDLGHVDADGYVYLTGRAKDLIIRGGHNIDPRVIEEALLEHPSVTAVAAVGSPDAHAGEVPVAYVVPADPGAFDEAGLLKWAAKTIGEPAARPRRIYAIPAIPVTAVGKYFKPALAADAARRAVAGPLDGAGVRGAGQATVTPEEEGGLAVPAAGQSAGPVIIVGAGPVGTTAALLLADAGIGVIMLERHAEPHPLPRAVHLDDEVVRTLSRAGVGADFLARSRPCSGLRLLDARHQVMAELGRAASGVHGVPQANMFHQPDLEELLLGRAARHPLITLHRADVVRLGGPAGAISSSPVTVTARTGASGQELEFAGSVVLGCDGAGSTVRDLVGLTMEDLGFTERWLVIDVRVAGGLDAWDGVEQVCDPARGATFMQVTGDRYRWEFQLRDGEDEADLLTPAALGGLLAPWTGRADLHGLEVVRSASYVFRARLASSFRSGRVFLLGDAAHLTPPFIGQGLAAGLRDADNLAWKIAHVLTGQAGEDLLDSYDAERRPHARAMVKRAVMIGWAMTGGQDRAAAVRRVALAAAVRVAPVRDALAATATPRLKAGALRPPGKWRLSARPGSRVRPGSLIPNPLVRTPDAAPVRLDAILAGRTTVLTARQPEGALADLCDRYGMQLLRIRPQTTADEPTRPCSSATRQPDRWVEVQLAGGELSGPMRALVADPALAILVRPDRVIAVAAAGRRLPVVPWPIRSGVGAQLRAGDPR